MRFISIDDISYLEYETLGGLNLWIYCNNNPIMYVDYDGNSPEWWQWLLSGVFAITGIVLSATGVGVFLGGILLGAGAGSIINGYVNEANGGSFTAGYWGGIISGALCGIGAGIGGCFFAAASNAVNYACIGYLLVGATTSFAGGFAGNLFGTMMTSRLDGTFSNINWGKTVGLSVAIGVFNVFAGLASGVGSTVAENGKRAAPSLMYISNIGKYTNDNIMTASRLLAGGIATLTEGIFDIIGFILGIL